MYIYLYDQWLKEKKYESAIRAIETRLTDFGIAGKIIRLQAFTDPAAIIREEIKRGATTAVIVGNDDTLGHVLSKAATEQITFGFLPVGPKQTIAEVLGIPVDEEACDVLSRRRKLRLDVGWFNNKFFVNQLHIAPSDIAIEYDERFKVTSTEDGLLELVVCNLQPFYWKDLKARTHEVHPQDGKLEAFLRPAKSAGSWFRKKFAYEEPSIFPFEEMIVSSRTAFPVVADGKKFKEKRIKIKLAKGRIEMVVGRERQF